MLVRFTRGGDPSLPTLRQVVEKQQREYNAPTTFIFDGYVYALLMNDRSKSSSVRVEPGERACMNLKSQTIRGLSLDTPVKPVRVEIVVDGPKTHRFSS